METEKISSPKRLRKKIKIAVGDVLLIPQANGKFTTAYIIGLWPNMQSIMSVALLAKEVSTLDLDGEDLIALVSREIDQRNIIAVVSTTTGTAMAGEWAKIGEVSGIDVSALLPNIPYKTGSAKGGIYESAPLVEALVSAYRGLSGWDESMPGRPGYLKGLLYSESCCE